ncbi:MAG: hypothetical protein ACJAU3_001194 [Zhongshania sp.]
MEAYIGRKLDAGQNEGVEIHIDHPNESCATVFDFSSGGCRTFRQWHLLP